MKKRYLEFRSIMNSGYSELEQKCIAQSEPIRRAFYERSDLAQSKAVDANVAQEMRRCISM